MRIHKVSQHQLRHIALSVRDGATIIYPTETVYGLGCDPLNQIAIGNILQLKRRSVSKGLVLVAAKFEQLSPYLDLTGIRSLQHVFSTWPGPHNWVFPAQAWVPTWLTGDFTSLAVRLSSHPFVQQLCQYLHSPIVSTSANISGDVVARNGYVVHKKFRNSVDIIVPGAPGPYRSASEIRDVLTDRLYRPMRGDSNN